MLDLNLTMSPEISACLAPCWRTSRKNEARILVRWDGRFLGVCVKNEFLVRLIGCWRRIALIVDLLQGYLACTGLRQSAV
jgi:hypothetical protein